MSLAGLTSPPRAFPHLPRLRSRAAPAGRARKDRRGGRRAAPAARAGAGGRAHDADAIGEAKGLGQVVRHQKHRLPYPRLQLQELPLQLQPRQRVERPERLVEEEHRRVDGEGAGEGGALALAAGELERVARAVTVGVEPDERQRLARAGGAARLVPAEEARHQLDVARHRPVGEEPALLRHVAGAAAQRDRIEGVDRPPLDAHRAGGGLGHAVEAAQEGSLAAAALADQSDGFAAAHRQVHPRQRDGAVGVLLAHPHRLERGLPGLHWHAAHGRRQSSR